MGVLLGILKPAANAMQVNLGGLLAWEFLLMHWVEVRRWQDIRKKDSVNEVRCLCWGLWHFAACRDVQGEVKIFCVRPNRTPSSRDTVFRIWSSGILEVFLTPSASARATSRCTFNPYAGASA